MSPSDAPNIRTVAQSIETAVEGTRAQAVLASLSSDRKNAMMSALATLDHTTRDTFMQRFMGMSESSAPQIIDEAIAAGQQAQGSTYTVQKGDSLSKIAKAHDLSLSAVIKANPQIKNPDLIHPDQKITLPRH